VRGQAAGGGGLTTDFPAALLRYGIAKKLELQVGLPDYFVTEGGGRGFGDGLVGVKSQIYASRNGNALAAVRLFLSLPIHSQFSTGSYDPGATFIAQTTAGSRWGLSANFTASNPTAAGRRIFTVQPLGAVSYQASLLLGFYADVYETVPRRGPPSPFTDEGITYLVSLNLSLTTGVGFGLGAGVPVRAVTAGAAYRF